MSNFGPRKVVKEFIITCWKCIANRLLAQNLTANLDQRKHSGNLKVDQNCNLACDHKFRRKKALFLSKIYDHVSNRSFGPHLNCSKVYFGSRFEVRLWTKCAFAMHF